MKCDKKDLLLYAVTDRSWLNGETLYSQVEKALEGGATFVQLREKHLDHDAFLQEAKEIKDLCAKYQVPFVLDDDRGGDVRHDSERENSGVAERTAGEDVQQTQKSVAFQLAGIRRTLAQGVGVDARNHDETTQAVDQQKPDRVNDTLAKLLDLVDILERFYQFLVGRQKSDYHQKDDTNNEILIHNFWVLRLLTVFRRCPRLP